jgi:hypothetical protein
MHERERMPPCYFVAKFFRKSSMPDLDPRPGTQDPRLNLAHHPGPCFLMLYQELFVTSLFGSSQS